MSLASASGRRSRSAVESDEEAETIRGSHNKRVRTNRYQSDAQLEDLDSEVLASASTNLLTRMHQRNLGDEYEDETGNEERDGTPNTFQPGAIVRVKLTNFVTYESAEFFPGPSLNMVIGPNGTGKSSLVCALCLGLGWGPQVLGRATDVGSYVKNGMDHADIEIELQRKPEDNSNYIVRVRITKDGNSRDWWLNGRKTSLRAIQMLTKSLSIQIDNLCQFLPQDKVSAFSGITPVELLQRTQEAAAPEYMLEWHNNLKKLRKEEKDLHAQNDADQATLENLETRQQNLQAEVERLQERQAIEERVKFLKYALPMVEYRIGRARHDECKTRKQQAQARLQQLEDRIGPTLQSINEKKQYKDQIQVVAKERHANIKLMEQGADRYVVSMGELDTEIQAHEAEIKAELSSITKRKGDSSKHQLAIRNLTAQLNEPLPEFNAADFNNRAVRVLKLSSFVTN
jgi:chromosome segregation ATPase